MSTPDTGDDRDLFNDEVQGEGALQPDEDVNGAADPDLLDSQPELVGDGLGDLANEDL
jgi:hypothetical protein